MWHNPYMHVTQGNFQLLMVGNQIDTLIFCPSFGHKVCVNTNLDHANPF